MKLSFKTLIIVSTISILIVFSSAAVLFHYQNKRIQMQISLVEKSLNESFSHRPYLSTEDKQATLKEVKRQLTQGARRNLKMVLMLLAFSIFVTTGIAYLLILRMTGKLAKMLVATRAIESGTYEQKLQINTHDELQHLAEAINHMATAIKERESALTSNNDQLLSEIAERKKSELKLLEQKAYLKNLLDTVKAGIVLIDVENHTIVDANASVAEMIGCRVEDMLGQHCWGFFCPAENGYCPITCHNEALNNAEKTMIKASGEIIPILKTACSIQINGKKHIIESMLDLSELKQAQNDQRALREQLLQSQKMESIGKLVGGIAHDFNNMLSGVLGYNELARMKTPTDSNIYGYLSQVSDAATRAANVTRQLLLFSRKDPIEKNLIETNDLIENMMGMLPNLLGEKLQIEMNLEPGIPKISGNAGQLEQVVMNLAINARDAMPDGGTLKLQTQLETVSTRRGPEHEEIPPGSYVKLTVADTGIGIPADVISNIFIPFYTTKPKEQGTGLGLSTVYGIIRQHDGYIFVDSSPGRGTRFSIYFPVSTEEEKSPSPETKAPIALHGDAKIFIVEDELIIRNLVKDTLTPLGFSITGFSDAEACITNLQAHENPPDILITDVVLPGMSGVDFLNHIKGLDHEMKIIIMTGYTDNMDDIQTLVDGGAIFIEKPLTPDKLIRAMDSCLKSAS